MRPFLETIWLLGLALWPLSGVVAYYTGPPYRCGNHGVQIQLPPGYLGGNVTFLVRDEFGVAYGFSECVSRCVFMTQNVTGETIIYVTYTICISFREKEVWKLLVRLVGSNTSKDITLHCPKPKPIIPKVINRTKAGSTKFPPTTVPIWTFKPKSTTQISLTTPVQADDPVRTKTTPKDDDGTKEPDDDVPTPATQTALPPKTTQSPGTQCIVPSGRIPCLNSAVSRDTCLRYKCCYDPEDIVTPCYYGNTVTVDCTDETFYIVASRNVTVPPLDLATVVLGPGKCPTFTIAKDFLVANASLRDCGFRRVVQGRTVYDLVITATQESPFESFIDDENIMVISDCPVNLTLKWEPVVSPSLFPSVINSGVLDVELHISKDSSFLEFYAAMDYPITITLRELLYFEVKLLQPSDPRLHLRLHNCWGAPDLDPAPTIRWPLINNGCPYTGDEPMTQLISVAVPSRYQRFSVSAFTFLESNSEVYVFCSVSICVPSPSEDCTTDCTSLKRDRRFGRDTYLVTTAGPFIFQKDAKSELSSLHHLSPALPGILLAVVLLSLLCLVGTLKLGFTLRSRGCTSIK